MNIHPRTFLVLIINFCLVLWMFMNNAFGSIYSYLGVFFFLNVAYDFYRTLNNAIPVKQLMILIALLQWVIAPLLSYHFFTESQFYGMQVEEELYMSFVVPGIFFFYLGLSIVFNRSNLERNLKDLIEHSAGSEQLKKRGQFLYVIGVLALLLQTFSPVSLRFAFFLLAKLIYIGAFYLLAARVPFRYLWLGIAFFPLIIGAQGSTIFHDLFLWGGFIFLVYALINKINALQKISFIAFGIFSVLFVQYFKQDYREELLYSNVTAGTSAIIDVTEKKYESEGITQDYFQSVVDRLNQGWIIARIMFVVPQYEDFAEGETINEGVKAAIVPRFLDPDKVVSGGAYFERFTKIDLGGASMNLGLIGEAYANYGVNGSFLFLFIVGWFFKLVFNFINRFSFKYYEILLWLPFLFLYVVKAEDDFSTMFNQFTKSAIVCWFAFYIMDKLYPIDEAKDIKTIKKEALS